jgi:hypothetical protein
MSDGSVGLEFMIDDDTDAEEVRTECIACDRVAEVRILDEPGWVTISLHQRGRVPSFLEVYVTRQAGKLAEANF